MSIGSEAGIRDALLGTKTSPVSTARSKPAVNASAAGPAEQERDVWYGGYAGRTMLGGFVLCLVLSAAVTWGFLHLWPTIRPARQEAWLTAVIGALTALWLFQVFRWAYRKTAFQIHLSTRRLFYDRGFLYSDRRAIDLNRVGRVEVRRNPWERCLGVGRIFVFEEGNERKPLVLEGIARPLAVAELVRTQALIARELSGRHKS